MPHPLILVKSFTTNPAEGSAAGVVLDADALTDDQMLAIAQALGFPETAFIQTSTVATYRTWFFSPRQEVPFCGHATLAAFHVLERQGHLPSRAVTQETLSGILPVEGRDDGLILMTQRDPEFWPPETDRAKIAHLLGLRPSDLLDYPIQTVSTGTPKLLIGIRSLATLRCIQPDLDGIIEYDRLTGNRGFCPFTPDAVTPGADFAARQFNPTFDRNEDPITGVAAGALISYIVHHQLLPKRQITIDQGFDLDANGRMTASFHQHVTVGGHAVIYDERIIEP